MITRKKRQWIQVSVFAFIALLIVVITASLNYQHLQRQAARIPAPISQDLTFSPFIVTLDNKKFKATEYNIFVDNKGTPSSDDDAQLLSYYVHFDGNRVTVTQGIQPPQFTEIPEFKQRFLDAQIKQYATVQTANGTIYLGRQVKQNDRQLGIMLERGLIVIFNPEKELTQAEWRRLGDQFDIQKISN